MECFYEYYPKLSFNFCFLTGSSHRFHMGARLSFYIKAHIVNESFTLSNQALKCSSESLAELGILDASDGSPPILVNVILELELKLLISS